MDDSDLPDSWDERVLRGSEIERLWSGGYYNGSSWVVTTGFSQRMAKNRLIG